MRTARTYLLTALFLIVSLVTSSQIARANFATPSDNGTGQLALTMSVVQGQGEICASGRDLMPVCTTSNQTVAVNNGALVNFDSTPDTGFVWDHYDGLGVGQAQNFNANITQNAGIGAYFVPGSDVNANVTMAASPALPNVTSSPANIVVTPNIITNITATTTLSNDSTSVTLTTPPVGGAISSTSVPRNATVTVTQYLNQTISVTQTVANATISYTVTYTVANTTVTQANVTITVNATTTTASTTGH